MCLLLIFSSSLFLSCGDFATDDRKNVNLVLKKEGKTYLFSPMGTMITKNKLDNNESPPIVTNTQIVKKNENLYVEPRHLENIAAILSGNYVVHDYQEKSYDGYITKGKLDIYNNKYSNQSTEKIGKMISTANIYLMDIEQTKKHQISWQRKPSQSPTQNCVEMNLWADRSYKPGNRTVALEKFIMVDLNDIVEFYDSKTKLDYNKEDEILYFLAE